MDKSFERHYSINVARLKPGQHEDDFKLDQAFFEAFDWGFEIKGELDAALDMAMYNTHLDTNFVLKGSLELACDRCGDLYAQPIESNHRIIYSFDEDMNFDDDEVIYVNRHEARLSIVQELYDFVNLSVPIRKVPETDIHLCKSEVLELLGLESDGSPKSQDNSSEIDPRWAKLKDLKDKLDS